MIDALNEIIRDLIQSRITRLRGTTQIGFNPPDDVWRSSISDEERLNIYLYDLKENTKLRLNERTREINNGMYTEQPAPERLDCHYLITAWSPIVAGVAEERTPDEHALLYEVLAVLMRHRPLTPAEVYGTDMTIPPSIPEQWLEDSFPLEAALPDGFGSLGDFWNTMNSVWKPALQMTVTIPIVTREDKEFPMVTTVIGDYRIWGDSESEEVLLSIGGHVVVDSSGEPVKGAWVQLQGINPPEVAGVNFRMYTREDGRFLFSRISAGRYRLRAVAPHLGERIREDVDVPSETGEYDLRI